jgi:hypothetical protein
VCAGSGLRLCFQLRERARTDDEDIYESFCALLPVRAGHHVGDADKRPKEIDRIEVLADVAAFDRALRQRANRFVHLSVGSFEHLLTIADQGIERWGDELFCCDGINEEQQPGSQRFDRCHGLGELSLCCG